MSLGKSFLWVLLFGLLPLCVSGLLFFLTKRKSGWGRVVLVVCLVWFLVCFDLPALMDLLGPCTNVVLTAYAHVRTEPQCDIGHTREKKICKKLEMQKFGFTTVLCQF